MSETSAPSTTVTTTSSEVPKDKGDELAEKSIAHRPRNHVMFRMTRTMAALVVQRMYRGWRERKLSLNVSMKLNVGVCRLGGSNP